MAQTGTVSDFSDGRVYKIVVIGDQTWMAENLNDSKFQNGDPIPEAKSIEDWIAAGNNGKPAWCYYNNDPSKGNNYGKLYNWHAVNDPRRLAPNGWHIPTRNEWFYLQKHLGGYDYAGKKMKSKYGWTENGNGTNESGFLGLPSGMRGIDGKFYDIETTGRWWSSSFEMDDRAWSTSIYNDFDVQDASLVEKKMGFSVRFIKDATNSTSTSNSSKTSNSTQNTSSNNIQIQPNNSASNSNNQTVNSDRNLWKEEAIKALNNRKVNILSNSSQKKCSWCSNSINCTKKTDEQVNEEIIRSKGVTLLLVMGILSEGDLEKKSKNPMFISLINSPIEIELYDCPKYCSRKCENESYKAGY